MGHESLKGKTLCDLCDQNLSNCDNNCPGAEVGNSGVLFIVRDTISSFNDDIESAIRDFEPEMTSDGALVDNVIEDFLAKPPTYKGLSDKAVGGIAYLGCTTLDDAMLTRKLEELSDH